MEICKALRIAGRYHAFLRRASSIFEKGNANSSLNHALNLAVNSINDTAGLNVLFPIVLLFRVILWLHINPCDLPAQLKAVKDFHKEAPRTSAQLRCLTLISPNVPHAVDFDIWIREKVPFFKEKSVAEWTGAFVMANSDKKILTVDSGDRNWLKPVDEAKLYRHHLQDINRFQKNLTNLMVTAFSSENWTLFFGSLGIRWNRFNSVSQDAFVLETLALNHPRVSKTNFVHVKKRAVFGLHESKLRKL